MLPDQLNQRLLVSVVQDQAPLLEILSHKLSEVAPSLFHYNREMRKNKVELINEISTTLIDVSTESGFRIINVCAWLYRIYWAKVGNIKELYSSFQKTLLTECGINIDQISVLFDGYTVESKERPEQKRRKKNFASIEMKADWNYSNSSELEKQQQAATD